MEELWDFFEFRCFLEDCFMLEKEVNKEEICKVFFYILIYKLSGIVDFIVSFLKLFGI